MGEENQENKAALKKSLKLYIFLTLFLFLIEYERNKLNTCAIMWRKKKKKKHENCF